VDVLSEKRENLKKRNWKR